MNLWTSILRFTVFIQKKYEMKNFSFSLWTSCYIMSASWQTLHSTQKLSSWWDRGTVGTTTHHHFLSIVFVRFFHCFSSLLSLPFFFLFFYLSLFFFLSLSSFCFLCLIILSSYFLDLSIAFSLVKLSPTAIMCHHLNHVTGCAFNQSCKQIIQWYRGRLKQTFEDKQTVATDK